jgi:hypothetical protein
MRCFSGDCVRFERDHSVGVRQGPQTKIQECEREADDGTGAAAGALAPCADFVAHQPEQFRKKNRCDQNGQEPGVNFGEQVQSEAARREWPKWRDEIGLQGVQKQVKQSRCCNGQGGKASPCFAFCKTGDQESRHREDEYEK